MPEPIHNQAAGEDLFYRAFEEEFRGSRELMLPATKIRVNLAASGVEERGPEAPLAV